MKKVLVIASVLALFSACKKDYVCECTSGSTTTKTTIKDVTKARAQANCVSTSQTYGSLTVTETCSLK